MAINVSCSYNSYLISSKTNLITNYTQTFNRVIICRWYNGEVYLVVVNMRESEYTVDLTYFENVSGDVRVILGSVQSQKNEGYAMKSLNFF